MNTDYILRLERGQNEQKSSLWMNVVLVASLLAGMVLQSGADLTDSSAAGVAKWVKKKVK